MDEMAKYVVRANIDHYFSILTTQGLTEPNRDTVVKLMIAEEDKLSHDLEQLQFAEERCAKSVDRKNHLTQLRNGFADGSTARAHADRLLANFEATHQLMVQFCGQMRQKANARRI